MIEAQGITKRFGDHTALESVSLTVPEGQVFGLLGPNGAGKTTLIRIITRITGPDEGRILMNGRPMTDADVAHMGYLPEERGLYKKMKVGEQALYLARLKGLSKADATKRLKERFERWDMGSWWNKKVEELSKGM
ncbi:MAG TPA: ATP-binding cassette domain-containing protein, partial [Flavobacteriales bacterium]|nr:ATP-binding cassette domain-containing protein [Flavobacteriales bacterium]